MYRLLKMAAFVEIASLEEQAEELARLSVAHLTDKEAADSFIKESNKLVETQNFSPLLSRFFGAANTIIGQPEKVAEPAFLLAYSFIKRLPTDTLFTSVQELISVLTSNTEDKPAFRLLLLNHAYNIVDTDNVARFQLFKAILKYSLASSTPLVVSGLQTDLERFAKTWNVGKETREVYRLFRDILISKGLVREAHEWNLKYLAQFTEESDPELASTTNYATDGVIRAINLPGVFSFDAVAELLPVRRLAGSSPVFSKLLNVFISGTLEDFRQFSPADLEQFKNAGLEQAEAENKLRSLTLATLGSQSNQIPYSTVCTALQIQDEDVEAYVVNAIADGTIDARLDQLKRIVNVSRTIQRQFSRAQWVSLGDTLQAWQSNLKNLLQSIDTTKE